MAKRKKKRKEKRKSNPREGYRKRILSILRRNPNRPLNYKQIASRLGVDNHNARNQIVKDLARLSNRGKIDQAGRGKYKIHGTVNTFEGALDMAANGNGYVVVEELANDIFIPHRKLNRAFDGDQVKAYCFGNPDRRKPDGEIIEVVTRKKTAFVGILRLKGNFGFVEINNPKMYTDIFVPRSKVREAKDGEMVLVTIKNWPKKVDSPNGEVLKVLGEPGKHETEMQSILASKGFSGGFPGEVEDFAQQLNTKIQKSEINKRRDLRNTLTFTIDPKDAKDFDDALSFKELKNGNYEVGIHIADVSHYVKPGTILDEEAYERGTSIYLVDRTVPMLPEILSNKACSLRPDEEKYTFSAIFELDENAKVCQQWFGRTVTKSDARFSYAEAQHIITTQKKHIPKDIALSQEAYDTTSAIAEAVLKLNQLAQKMRLKRMQAGAISFDKLEVKFKLDKEGEPIGIYHKESQEANKLIEEFMLLANKKVAAFIGKQNPKKPFVYRCHDQPDEEKLLSLKNLVGQFGYSLNLKNRQATSQSLNNLLKAVNGRKEQNLVDTLTIRSMSKAYYGTDNIGHYGLAFAYYTHFTSPIRRYPDVMVHRLLQHYLDGGKPVEETEYEEKCKHCSQTEVFATQAERDSIKYMQVKYMQQFKGQTFKGVISGVTDFGIFVEIEKNKCEGLVRLRAIKEDHFNFDESQYAIVGRHTGKKYQLGDAVRVKVKNTDLVKRNLDFELVTGEKGRTQY